MRRLALIVAVNVFVVLFGGAVAQAGGDVDVENREVPGGKLKVVARNCASGEGFTARVEIALFDPATNQLIRPIREVQADADGTTVVKTRIPAATDPGRYVARVRCIHVFDAGGTGVFYEYEESFRIVAP